MERVDSSGGSPSGVLDGVEDSTASINDNIHNSNKEDDIDIDELLARPRYRRGLFRRQKASYNKAPEFIKRLSAFEEAKAGSTVTFSCRWQALPRPTIKWYKDDEEITKDINNRYEFRESDDGELQLVINNCRKKDEAAYKCKAENIEGVASTTGYLSVTGDIKDKPLSAQPRKNSEHAVSHAPRLRAIHEQKSLELREEEECSSLPPSPIHDYVETFQKKHKAARRKSPPLPLDDLRKGDEDDSGSDTSVESQDFDRVRMNDLDSESEFDRERTPDADEILSNEGATCRVQGATGPEVAAIAVNGHAPSSADGLSRQIISSGNGATTNGTPNGNESRRRILKPKKQRERESSSGSESGENGPRVARAARVEVQYISSLAVAKVQSGPVLHGPVPPNTTSATAITAAATATPNEHPLAQKAQEKLSTSSIPAPSSAKSSTPAIVSSKDATRVQAATSAHQRASATTGTRRPLITLEFPWLLTLAFTSTGTLVATATDMNPILFVLLLAVISMLSFRILLTTKPHANRGSTLFEDTVVHKE